MWTDSPGRQLDPVRVTVLPAASFESSIWIACAGSVSALRPPMFASSSWIAGDVFPRGLALGSAMFAPSLWIVGDVLLPRSVMRAITIAGAASSVPHTTSRSRRLLLSFDSLPLVLGYIRYPPVGAASYLFVSGKVLTVCFATASTDYRVGRAAASARWPFLEKSVGRGMPGLTCTTHIVAHFITSSTRGRLRPRPGRAPSRGYPPPP